MVTSFSLLCRDSLKQLFACAGCIDRHRQGISTTLSWVTNAFFRVQCVSCWSVVSRPEASKNSGLHKMIISTRNTVGFTMNISRRNHVDGAL